MPLDPLEEVLQLRLVPALDPQHRRRGIVGRVADLEIQDAVVAAQRQDVVEHLRQRERVDDVTLEANVFVEHAQPLYRASRRPGSPSAEDPPASPAAVAESHKEVTDHIAHGGDVLGRSFERGRLVQVGPAHQVTVGERADDLVALQHPQHLVHVARGHLVQDDE